MDLGLKGKVAIVTGASQGMGAAISRRLAQEGCNVAMVARGEERLTALAAAITASGGGEALPVVCDVTSESDVADAVASAVERFGGVDMLVNNAGGLTTGALLPFEELSDDTFIATYELNVLGAVRFIRAVLPSMRQRGGGRIVNISSENGIQPDMVGADYNAAKAALNALSKTLSKSLGVDNILVNTLSPGLTKTEALARFIEDQATAEGKAPAEIEQGLLTGFRPNIAVGRAGEPDEIAAGVAFLLSAPASFITGINLRVDGGSVSSIY
ncbi:MAG: SDR family NAD(P)-dependent oxidoreductase [Sphingomonadaceae bacterium]